MRKKIQLLIKKSLVLFVSILWFGGIALVTIAAISYVIGNLDGLSATLHIFALSIAWLFIVMPLHNQIVNLLEPALNILPKEISNDEPE